MSEKYQLMFELGAGSFGKACVVKEKKSDKKLVSKVIKIKDLSSVELDRCVTEIAILSFCRHVNIVQYIEAFVRDGCLNIIMEYASGGDLHQKIKQQNGVFFTKEVVLDWFLQVVLALQYIHSRNILHRDLKPQNVFLTDRSIVKLGDFGISKILSTNMDLASTRIGTPFYISPEICEKKPYNSSSDMWAAGCLLYEMCMLRVPFLAASLTELTQNIIRCHYQKIPRQFGATIPYLISRLLVVSPGNRILAKDILDLDLHDVSDKVAASKFRNMEFHTCLRSRSCHRSVQVSRSNQRSSSVSNIQMNKDYMNITEIDKMSNVRHINERKKTNEKNDMKVKTDEKNVKSNISHDNIELFYSDEETHPKQITDNSATGALCSDVTKSNLHVSRSKEVPYKCLNENPIVKRKITKSGKESKQMKNKESMATEQDKEREPKCNQQNEVNAIVLKSDCKEHLGKKSIEDDVKKMRKGKANLNVEDGAKVDVTVDGAEEIFSRNNIAASETRKQSVPQSEQVSQNKGRTFAVKSSIIRRLSSASPKLSETVRRQRFALSVSDPEALNLRNRLFMAKDANKLATDSDEDNVFDASPCDNHPGTSRARVNSKTYTVLRHKDWQDTNNNTSDTGSPADISDVLLAALSVSKQGTQLYKQLLFKEVNQRLQADRSSEILRKLQKMIIEDGQSYLAWKTYLKPEEKELIPLFVMLCI